MSCKSANSSNVGVQYWTQIVPQLYTVNKNVSDHPLFVYTLNMSDEKATFDIQEICEICGVTLSDINRISSVSRTTLYSLGRGEFVRKATVVRLLQCLLLSAKCIHARPLIRQHLRRLSASGGNRRTASDIVQTLDDLVIDIATIHDAPGKFDLGKLEELVLELDRTVKNL